MSALDHLENSGTPNIVGFRTFEKYLPGFKVTQSGRTLYVTEPELTPEFLEELKSNKTGGNHGGKRKGAGRKSTLDKNPGIKEIIELKIQEHSRAHPRRGTDIVQLGVSAPELSKLLKENFVSACPRTIRYWFEAPSKSRTSKKRYQGIFRAQVNRVLINDKAASSRSTVSDVRLARRNCHTVLKCVDPAIGRTALTTLVLTLDQKANRGW